MPNKKSVINLLPQEEFNVTITGRVIHWAMGTFRIIVIVTEMIVMAAFLSRFWLDSQNSDLNGAIKVKSAQIAALSETEKEFRSVQLKVDVAEKILLSKKPTQIMDVIISKVPSLIVLTKISILEESALVSGTSQTESSISQFINNLKTVETFKNVNLTEVDSSKINPGQTMFSIKITY